MKRNPKKRRNPAKRRAPVGASPGTIFPDPDAAASAVRLVAYDEQNLIEEDVTDLASLRGRVREHAVTWVNVDGLGDESVIQRVADAFDMHLLAVEDIVHVNQRPKVDDYGDHRLIVLRMLRSNDSLETEQFSLLLGPGFVLTFQEQKGDCLEPVRVRIREGRQRIRGGSSSYLAYAMLDAIVDAYFPLLEHYGDLLEELEADVLEHQNQATIAKLHEVKRDLATLRRYIWPLRELMGSLSRDESGLIDESTQVYLRDCHDHALRLMDIVESYRDVSSGLMDLYLSIVSNRMNEVMKVLTIIATLFIPLSFIAGVYGMNFNTEKSPWNLPELNWYFGYPFALGLMVAVAVVLLLYFRRKGWLG
jgi:magnesium transporter